jgi:hypothetical protein
VAGKKAARKPTTVVYGAKPSGRGAKESQRKILAAMDPTMLGPSRPARLLAMIRRDMDGKDALMRRRRRYEEVLSLAYCDSTALGGDYDWKNLRENGLNLPYRYARWVESQLVSKRMVVKVNRDAGESQRPSGPGDNAAGMWVAKCLERVAYEGGFDRELPAVSGEVLPRGTSVMAIGYHEDVIDLATAQHVGKDSQSVIPEVLGDGDLTAKPGQAHAEIAAGLGAIAEDPMFQAVAGKDAVGAVLTRKDAHDVAAFEDETKVIPRVNTRLTRRRLWMRKRRVAEEVGWVPYVYDVEDSTVWWERRTGTVDEIKGSPLFTDAFKAKVEGYDGHNVSGVARGGQTTSTESMGSDARQAQSEDVLEKNERVVEYFLCWIRQPQMRSGGIRKIVCAECPDEFVEADESNPHVDENGDMLIPTFFPYYDFTPIKSSLTVPERTCGIPPIAVGMPHFEKIAEYERLMHESALRHSLRFYDIHPAHKDDKKLLNALRNGEDGYAQIMSTGQITPDGKISPSIMPIQFTGNTMEVDRQAAREEANWVKVMGMPPAVLQGVGTAETATQDQQGIAAGERESGALVTYFEKRMADVLSGLRGLMRGCYDDEDFVRLLGEEGAKVMKEWQTGTVDDGDMIHVTFGANAEAQKTVDRKQLMEAIKLLKADVDPVTGLEKYDTAPLVEELHRSLDLGAPRLNASMVKQLQEAVMVLAQQVQGGAAGGNGSPPENGKPTNGGPNASEGSGPRQGTLNAGAMRGTVGNDSQAAIK